MLRAIAIAGLLLGLTPSVARGAPWRWPVRGEVVGAFAYDPADPYRAGQRRGLAIAAPPGVPVRAACSGQVVFAGSVGRSGPTLSVACGELRATYQGLTIAIAEGRAVEAGDRLGRVSHEGVLRLGARRGAADYADPATLLAAKSPPLGPAPPVSAPRTPRRIAPGQVPPRPSAAPPTPAPLAAWIATALLALAVPVGTLRRRTQPGRARRNAPSPAIDGAGAPRS